MANDSETGDRPVPSGADDLPTPDEEAAADKAAASSPDVSAAYTEAAKTGGLDQGRGEIE